MTTNKRSVDSSAATIGAVVKARKTDIRDRAATALALDRMADLAGQGRTKEEVVAETGTLKAALEKAYKKGHAPWGADVDHTTRDLLRTINAAVQGPTW
jgi:hypothetical protein